MHALLAFLKANPAIEYVLAYMVLTVIVGLTPQKWQKTPFFGFLLALAHRLSVLTHADQGGTFQIPLMAKAIGAAVPALAPVLNAIAEAPATPAEPAPADPVSPPDPPRAA
jgi:hypothetical protein